MRFRDKQQVTICAIGAATVCVFSVFCYLPLRNEANAVSQGRTEQVLAIARGDADARRLPLLKEQMLRLETKLANYEANIPEQRAHGVFLHKIADLMKENNLGDQVITPGKEIEADKFNCIPLTMQCKGELAQISEFYRRLQTLDRLVRIERVSLSNDENYSGQVSMETDAVVYYRTKTGQG